MDNIHSAVFLEVADLKLESRYSEGTLAVFLRGELDQHTAPEVFREIESAVDRYLPRNLALDLSGLTFMDSSGIAVILRARKRMGETGGQVCILDPSPQPRRVLNASGMDRMVKIKNTKGWNAP